MGTSFSIALVYGYLDVVEYMMHELSEYLSFMDFAERRYFREMAMRERDRVVQRPKAASGLVKDISPVLS